MDIQYFRTVSWDVNLINAGVDQNQLVVRGEYTVAGAPVAKAGYYSAAAIIQNKVDGIAYINNGTTASPVFNALEDGAPSLSVTVALTSAQILALHTTPISLVPAVSGKSIVIDSYVFTMNFVTSAYTGANNLEIRYTNGSGTKVAADVPSAVLDISSGSEQYANLGTPGVLTQNVPVVAAVPVANPAAGAGNASITIKYHLV